MESVLAVVALDLLSDHFCNFFNSNSRDVAKAGNDLFVLEQEDLGEGEFVRAKPHLLHLHDIADDLVNFVVVVGADLVKFVSLAPRIHLCCCICCRCPDFVLAEVFLPVGHSAVVQGESILATMVQLFRLHFAELFTVEGFVGELGPVSELIKGRE